MHYMVGDFLFIMIEEEIWKDIPTFEGHYQASTLGRIRSVDRVINGISHIGRIKSFRINQKYYDVSLSRGGRTITKRVHVLIAMTFLGHVQRGCCGIVVDHIDNNPSNNRVDNLQIISHRENTSKDKSNKTSQYTGVIWYKPTKKWMAAIRFNGTRYRLGYHESEIAAHNAYQKALQYPQSVINNANYVRKNNLPKNIYPSKNGDKFTVIKWYNKKNNTIGTFDTLNEALEARDGFILTS